jgi:transcription elongation factor GreA
MTTMTQKTYITLQGKATLEERLISLEKELKEIQEEKAVAYHASGDGWHDNPGWIQIGQIEERLSKEIVLMRQKLAQSVVIVSEQRSSDRVQIGSIVRISQYHGTQVREMVFEIVGSGETNIAQKRLAYDTPLGAALINQEKGVSTSFEAPAGLVRIDILDISLTW